MIFYANIIIQLVCFFFSKISFPFYIKIAALAICAANNFCSYISFISLNSVLAVFKTYIVHFFIRKNLHTSLFRQFIQNIIKFITTYTKATKVKLKMINIPFFITYL